MFCLQWMVVDWFLGLLSPGLLFQWMAIKHGLLGNHLSMQVLMGNSSIKSINGKCPIAMFDCRMVQLSWFWEFSVMLSLRNSGLWYRHLEAKKRHNGWWWLMGITDMADIHDMIMSCCQFYVLPYGKLTWLWKIFNFKAKSSINEDFLS